MPVPVPPSASSPSRATCVSTCAALTRWAPTRSPYAARPSCAAVDGLVIPGGESTTMAKLARTFDLFEPLRDRVAAGMPAFGTCAGMIMLADRIEDGTAGQETIGGLDITVRRNAFGRQVDSFEAELDFAGLAEPVHAVFIRAPWVEQVGRGRRGARPGPRGAGRRRRRR